MFVKIKDAANSETINLDQISVYYITGHAKNVLFFKNFRYKTITMATFKGKQETLDAILKLENAIINKAPFIEI
jgi:hypothetical protein